MQETIATLNWNESCLQTFFANARQTQALSNPLGFVRLTMTLSTTKGTFSHRNFWICLHMPLAPALLQARPRSLWGSTVRRVHLARSEARNGPPLLDRRYCSIRLDSPIRRSRTVVRCREWHFHACLPFTQRFGSRPCTCMTNAVVPYQLSRDLSSQAFSTVSEYLSHWTQSLTRYLTLELPSRCTCAAIRGCACPQRPGLIF